MYSDRYPFQRFINRPCLLGRLLVLLLIVLFTTAPIATAELGRTYEENAQHETASSGISDSSLFSPPATAKTSIESEQHDDIFLVNSRELGTVCKIDQIASKLRCERYIPYEKNKSSWLPVTLEELFTACDDRMPTVIYVHGNRVARGVDRTHGMMVYHSLVKRGHPTRPIRFIIWSWPSAQISGTIHDYRVKAARTGPVGWQLAWLVDRLPAETPLSLVGYSYGARVISGSLHLLGGGQLSGLKLADRVHATRSPVEAVYIAAAFDVGWAQPTGYHGKAFSQIDRLTLVNNRHDPAMRFFHFSTRGQRVRALGWAGLSKRSTLHNVSTQIQSFDVTDQVGRSHALSDYLAVSQPINQIWEQLCSLESRTMPLARLPRASSPGVLTIQPATAEQEAIADIQ